MDFSSVVELVGGAVMETAGRNWVWELRERAGELDAMPLELDMVRTPAAASYLRSLADMVEANLDLEGADGLADVAELFGVDIARPLELAIEGWAARAA